MLHLLSIENEQRRVTREESAPQSWVPRMQLQQGFRGSLGGGTEDLQLAMPGMLKRGEQFEEEAKKTAFRADLESQRQQLLTEILQTNEQRRSEITQEEEERRNSIRQFHADRAVDIVAGSAQQMIGITFDMLEQRIEGDRKYEADLAAAQEAGDAERITRLQEEHDAQKSVFAMIAKQFLKTMGAQLTAQGIMDISKGVSRGLSSYGFDPTAAGLVAWGAAEVGSGIAMQAGSLLIPGAGSVGGVGGSGDIGGGAGGAGGSGSGGIGAKHSGDGGGGGITIIVTGAMTNDEVAVNIARGLASARERGLM